LIIQFSSINKYRTNHSTIDEFYDAALKASKNKITYKVKKETFFILSGIDDKKNIYYWKRSLGENFLSDLYIEYPPSKKKLIEPYLAIISNSFVSD